MGSKWMWCGSGLSIQSANRSDAVLSRFHRVLKLTIFALFVSTVVCSTVRAQTNDTGEPTMTNVNDVAGGMKYLLRNDDLAMVQVSVASDGTVTTSLVTMDTSGSKLSGTQQTTTVAKCVDTGLFNPHTGVVASEASGRMYNIKADTVALLNAGDNCDQPPALGSHVWLLTLADSTGIESSHVLQSRLQPHGTVYTQVVMGDFNGDGLADPLVFYASVDGGAAEWGMRAMTAADPKTRGSLSIGPEMYGNTQPVPVTDNIVVGDFNGDGRDEIAALLTDYQTIAFYSVDPKTLAITPTTTVKLPYPMVSGQVALTAGRFRQCGGNGNPCQTSGVTNADLVVFGQIDHGGSSWYGYSVIPIKITPNSNGNGSFTAAYVKQQNATDDKPFYRFTNYYGENGALAQAAPLALWPQQTDEQLVLGIRTANGASYIMIGSFLPDDGLLDTFDWESETERVYDASSDYLQNMWVGNFDHQNSDGTHNAGLQIETYELVLGPFLVFQPHINIFNVTVPSPFPPAPPKTTNWLTQPSDNTSGLPSFLGDPSNLPIPSPGFLTPSDMQGRSLELGSPTIVRIPKQMQPDLVMAIPPMHVDWIKPYAIPPQTIPGCNDPNTPCVLNVSVKPSVPPSTSAVGFATTFKFDSSSSSSAKQSSTTSWGVSVKESEGASFSFNDGLENASGSIKDTTKIAHDESVSKTYNTYTGTVQSLSATTGFSDFIFYTQREMNVYYYPVLGCNSDGTNCSKDGTSTPTYVVFSVPDKVVYNEVDSNTQDWYQPVHEPGNVLSYPWSLTQLESRFTDQLMPLTTTATCMSNGSGTQTANTTWNQGEGTTRSSGSTNSFSNELAMSYSEGAGVSGVDAANFNFSLDIAASTSLNTLNESSASLSSSQGITITKPDFGYTSQCCTYGFGQYIFGLKNTAHPASENACEAGQTPSADGCIAVGDPEGKKPVVVGGLGPLFTGYVANPLASHGSELTCSGNDSWWQNIYTQPDVALNHPERWNWDKNQQQATFNLADRTYPNSGSTSPIDQQFYFMKGFYISRQSAGGFQNLSLPSSPNLAEASPDDALKLTTRVYNYSLVDTTAPVHVRFYGQLYCSGSGSSDASCKDWKTGAKCTYGNLCGDSFQIGQDQIIPLIEGFESPDGNDAPNWQLASVDFLPNDFPATQKGKVNMVFWVVVWMQDANGKPIPEMLDHGLTATPGSGLTQITQVATELHSNNVGMYPVHQPFFILPQGAPGATPGSGSLQRLSLSTSAQIQLGQRTKVVATLQSAGAPTQSVNIAYYDGDPAKDGKMFDVQTISYMDPAVPYYHRSFFTPDTCGAHSLYAKAWLNGLPGIQASTATSVTLKPADFVQALIDSTETANIPDASLRSNLLAVLSTALQDFQQGQMDAGNTILGAYMQQLAVASGGGITAASVNQLTGQAGVVLGCGASGFSLTTSPSSATVSAGSPASYALAVTPIGGFTGKVSLACMGAPGIDCSFSSPSVTLDGSSQSRVTVTVNTNGGVSAAGIGGPPPGTSGKIKWFLMLLVAALAIASLQRARMRQMILGCVIALVLLGGIGGCGSNGSTAGIQPGTYPFTLQATSGNTVRNTLLVLVVK